MRFALEITTDNAAFDDAKHDTLQKLLRGVADRLCGEASRGDVETPGYLRTISDPNGNKVGAWSFYSA